MDRDDDAPQWGEDPAATALRLAQSYNLPRSDGGLGDYAIESAKHLRDGFNYVNDGVYKTLRQGEEDIARNPDWYRDPRQALRVIGNSPALPLAMEALSSYHEARIPRAVPRADGGEVEAALRFARDLAPHYAVPDEFDAAGYPAEHSRFSTSWQSFPTSQHVVRDPGQYDRHGMKDLVGAIGNVGVPMGDVIGYYDRPDPTGVGEKIVRSVQGATPPVHSGGKTPRAFNLFDTSHVPIQRDVFERRDPRQAEGASGAQYGGSQDRGMTDARLPYEDGGSVPYFAQNPDSEISDALRIARENRPQPEMKAYEPTWRDRLGGWLYDNTTHSPEARRFVEGLAGSRGLGQTGMSVADFTPGVGQALQAQEAYQAGDPKAFAMAVVPMPGASVEGKLAAAADPVADAMRIAANSAGAPYRGQPVEGLSGALAPSFVPRRGETSREILQMQRSILSQPEQQRLAELTANNPSFAHSAKFLLPNELKAIIKNPDMINSMNRLLDVIPSAAHFSALAKAGAPKQGWYRGSTQALIDVFGHEDAPRFASLLAATSPQTSVESNLTNALNIWKNWIAAGRPTDADAIKAIMGSSVQGDKGVDSVLGAWFPNTVRALSSPDPLKTVISGPKVDSFYRNLADDVYRVTNDAWIANATGIDQGLLRISPTAKQLAEGNPGLSPGYLAMNSRLREGGQKALMTPAEAQETVWSVAMPLMESQSRLDMPARQILDKGLLTHDLIRGTPDFATLLHRPEYASILEQAGYGDQLQHLVPHQSPPFIPELTLPEQRYLDKTAQTLESLRDVRGRESRGKVFYPGASPDRGFVYQPTEAIPGNGTGFFSEMHALDDQGSRVMSEGQRDAYSNSILASLKDQQGHDVINRALGLDTVATRPGQGAYQPEGKPIEFNATGVAGAEVPLTKRGMVTGDAQKALDASAMLKALALVQHGVPNVAEVRDIAGPNLAIAAPKKLQKDAISAVLGDYPASAVVDTGYGANVLNFGSDPFTNVDAEKIAMRIAESPRFERTRTSMGDAGYRDLQSKWAAENEGKGLVSKEVSQALAALPPAKFNALNRSSDVGDVFGRIRDAYSAKINRGWSGRQDVINALDLLSQQRGIDAFMQAVREGKIALPALGGAALLGDAMSDSREQSSEAGF